MALFTKKTKLEINTDIETVKQSITNPEKFREWNPQTLVRRKDEQIDWNEMSENKIVNILTINEEYGDHSKHIIEGTVEKLTTGEKQDDVKIELKEQEHNGKKWTQFITNIDPSLIRLGLTVSGGLAILKSLESTALNLPQAYAATTTTPIMSSIATTTSVGSSTTATFTVTSLISAKIVLTSIVAAMLITSGAYIAEPELFGLNQSMDGISQLILDDNGSLIVNSLLLQDDSSSYSDGKSSSSSTSDSTASSSRAVTSQNTNTESISTQTESTYTTNAASHSVSSGVSSQSSSVTSDSEIISLTENIGSRSFENPTFAVFDEGIVPSGIAIDSKGNMYATDMKNHNIKVYDPNSNVIKIIGKSPITPVSFEIPGFEGMSKLSSLFIQYAHAVEEILYCEINTGKGCIDPDGSGPLSVGDGQFFLPSGIAIDSNDKIYVVDKNNHRIQVFDLTGNFITKFGEFGSQDGQFNTPWGIAIDSNDKIYVVDNGNNRIQVFDLTGNFITKFGEFGSQDGQFSIPHGIAIDSNDKIYVVDSTNHRIQVFDLTGNFITKFGEFGSQDGQFNTPYSITIDGNNNNLYVVDSTNHRIQVFDLTGNFITKFGELGSQDNQFDTPWGIAIDSNNNLYVADIGNNRIQKISFEDVIVTFSEKFSEIRCDADFMINNPIQVSPEVAAALPVSELLSRADTLTFGTQQYEEGLLFYYITTQIEPTNVNAWNGIGYTQTQICSNDSAETAYNQSLLIDSNNINAKIGLADFTINQVTREGNTSLLKLEDAELQLQSVLDLDSKNTNVLNALGYIETLRDNYNMAINYYEQSLDIDDKKTTTLNELAFAYLRSDNLDESIIAYLKVTSIDPNNFNALVGLITAYTQQGFSGSAEQFIDRLDESSNMAADKLTEQGNWLQNNGQTTEAQRLFDAADKLK